MTHTSSLISCSSGLNLLKNCTGSALHLMQFWTDLGRLLWHLQPQIPSIVPFRRLNTLSCMPHVAGWPISLGPAALLTIFWESWMSFRYHQSYSKAESWHFVRGASKFEIQPCFQFPHSALPYLLCLQVDVDNFFSLFYILFRILFTYNYSYEKEETRRCSSTLAVVYPHLIWIAWMMDSEIPKLA